MLRAGVEGCARARATRARATGRARRDRAHERAGHERVRRRDSLVARRSGCDGVVCSGRGDRSRAHAAGCARWCPASGSRWRRATTRHASSTPAEAIAARRRLARHRPGRDRGRRPDRRRDRRHARSRRPSVDGPRPADLSAVGRRTGDRRSTVARSGVASPSVPSGAHVYPDPARTPAIGGRCHAAPALADARAAPRRAREGGGRAPQPGRGQGAAQGRRAHARAALQAGRRRRGARQAEGREHARVDARAPARSRRGG